MILLLDIGNTNTHAGLAHGSRVTRHIDFPTRKWQTGAAQQLRRFIGPEDAEGAAICSVVPAATPEAKKAVRSACGVEALELTHKTLRRVGIDYPEPWRIGPDRLANAAAAAVHFGAPSIVVDFGTAVTFDVLDKRGNYVGGIIAPGLSAMTDYLHEKTALLPRIRIADVGRAIGRSTREAMLIGAVHGYRGLIRGLLREVQAELKIKKLPVIATGGYAKLIACKMPEITAVEPLLTLEGLRLVWEAHRAR